MAQSARLVGGARAVMTNEQSREQLVVELVALRLRVQQLEAHGKDPRPSAGQPSPAEKLLRDSADGICGVDALYVIDRIANGKPATVVDKCPGYFLP